MQACLIVIAFYYYSFNSVLVKEVFTTNKCATREIACGYFMWSIITCWKWKKGQGHCCPCP